MLFRSKHHIRKLRTSARKTIGAAKKAKDQRNQAILSVLSKLMLVFSAIIIITSSALGLYLYNLSKSLPDVDSLNTYIPYETTKIYANNGKVILAELHREENRVQIPLKQISPQLKEAVIALEDTAFYTHKGINIKGLMRATLKNIQAGRFKEGGSTLTQQLARNVFLTKRKKIERKLQELILAIKIEKKFTKPEILEMYLNEVYWGHNAYGIESASKLYFGKSANELNLAEACGLVGMLKGPELYSPFKNMKGFKRRQAVVINRMKHLKLLSATQAKEAKAAEIVLADRKKHKYKAPFFTSYIVKQLIEMYGEESTYTSGMKVYTSLDYTLQEHAESVVRQYVEIGQKPAWIKGERVDNLNFTQGAMMAVDPRTGHIKALQGGVDFVSNEFNRCIQSKRQPGSSFKPFVYLTALKKGFSPGFIMDDAPIAYNTIEGVYEPQNYSLKFRGRMPLVKALERSVNVVAVKLNDLVGPENVVSTARKLGISSPLKPVLSLPLGANEVTMLELVESYMVLANRGIKVKPVSILKIEDRDGVILYKHKLKEEKVYDSNLIAILVDMMKNVVNYGTGRGAKLPRPMAGKTGTTSDYKDAWFAGFVPQLVCVTWVGNDDNTPMHNVTGGWIPARMWKSFMIKALSKTKAQAFPRPKGLESAEINWETGLRVSNATPENSKKSTLYYFPKQLPKKKDNADIIEALALKKTKQKQANDNLLDYFDIQ